MITYQLCLKNHGDDADMRQLPFWMRNSSWQRPPCSFRVFAPKIARAKCAIFIGETSIVIRTWRSTAVMFRRDAIVEVEARR